MDRKRCAGSTSHFGCGSERVACHRARHFNHSVDRRLKASPRGCSGSGVERCEKWSEDEKLAVLAESLADGAVVSEVGTPAQQFFGWRAKVRSDVAAARAIASSLFAPAVLEPQPSRPTSASQPGR